jgi:hypothetical protein
MYNPLVKLTPALLEGMLATPKLFVRQKQQQRRMMVVAVASIFLHSNQMWKDLMRFHNLIAIFEKFFKIK